MRIRVLILLLTSLALTACGYHLRGAYDLPKDMKNVYLQGGSTNFRSELENVLRTSAGKLVGSPEQADLVIKIYRDNIERRVLSLSGRGRSNEIELAGQLEYEILSPKKGVLVAKEPLDFRREYFNDQQDVIAKDKEETVIRSEMYQQVVRNVVTRSRMALATKSK